MFKCFKSKKRTKDTFVQINVSIKKNRFGRISWIKIQLKNIILLFPTTFCNIIYNIHINII